MQNAALPDAIIEKHKVQAEYDWMIRNFTVQGEVPELHHENSYASRLYSYMGQKNQVEWLLIHFLQPQLSIRYKTNAESCIPDMKLSQHLKQTYHDGHCNDGE